jgi:NAD(P)-dependent dehydrogenase (short-subunit alcohol dehydrogenase family)
MKILISGNPEYGVAQGLSNILGQEHELTFCSRKNGFELTKDEGRNKLVDLSLQYDVFINNSALWRFNQSILLEYVWKAWADAGKQGHIINMGSTADRQVKGGNWAYPVEKGALRHHSLNQSLGTLGGTGIKVSYIAYGYVSTPSVEKKNPDKIKHTPEEIAKLVKWVLDYPMTNTNIMELIVDPIQRPVNK